MSGFIFIEWVFYSLVSVVPLWILGKFGSYELLIGGALLQAHWWQRGTTLGLNKRQRGVRDRSSYPHPDAGSPVRWSGAEGSL